MHSHEMKEHAAVRHLSHLNFLFAETPLEHALVRTGSPPFALYRRFAIQRRG
jgi:hypothetical protein